MSVADIEAEIVAEGRRIRALAEKGALELRKSKIVAELETIEKKLAEFVSKAKPQPDPEPAPVKPAAKPAARKSDSR